MLNCFVTKEDTNAKPIALVAQRDIDAWINKQNEFTRNWLVASGFKSDIGNFSLIPNKVGQLSQVVCCVADNTLLWNVGHLPCVLPDGTYYFSNIDAVAYAEYAIAWGLGSYQFTRYKTQTKQPAVLYLTESVDENYISNCVQSIYFVRDLINTPTEDMGPTELAEVVEALGKYYHANTTQIIGEALLKNNYASIYTVGRASDDVPRLLDLRWGKPDHPKLTLVGKGVCFDSGGLDLKNASGMLLMKKDMGGAAHVLGLARMVMQAHLPVRLRVLIPAVENVISGNAYRPGDVIQSRKGLTIEIGNTDAEGRVVLADALTEAVSEQPELLIDMATLTGAARIALGTELPAVFCNQDQLVNELLQHATDQADPLWRLPLFPLYKDALGSGIADLNNASADAYGGAITAGLFLKEFVPDQIPWLHFDIMAWNLKSRPGRPQGGEAMGLRALFSYLRKRFSVADSAD